MNDPLVEIVWTTKAGEKIPLPDLEDQHLLNIINWLKKQRKLVEENLEAGYSLLGTIQGEMAIADIEQALFHFENLKLLIITWQKIMQKELERRMEEAKDERLPGRSLMEGY